MPLELRPDETVPKGLKRIAHARIDESLKLIHDRDHDVVHEVRKHCKQLRALVRLLRDELGEKAYRRQNERFRDLARPLTHVRDAEALLEALDKLEEHFGRKTSRRHRFEGLRRALRAHLAEQRSAVLEHGEALKEAERALRKGARDADRWRLAHRGWKAVAGGLERIYTRGRAAMRQARCDGADESLHAWRKETKYLRHQLELLEGAWPRVVEGMVDDLKDLGDELGDDHDLAVLLKMLDDPPLRDALTAPDRELLLALVGQRRSELQEAAFARGRRIYAERPSEFLRLLHRQWTAWHDA